MVYNKLSLKAHMNQFISMIFILNRVYDLMCALSILFLSSVPVVGFFSTLHPQMFANSEDANHPVIRRLLAYWLLTYGTVRVAAGFDRALVFVGAVTYFIEALCFVYEYRIGMTMKGAKVAFVSLFSVLLSLLCLCVSD